MSIRQPYSLFQRTHKLKDGKTTKVWCYWVYGEDGKRHMVSLSTTSKKEALAKIEMRTKAGTLAPSGPTEVVTFGKFAEGWWIPETCPYLRDRRIRGEEPGEKYIRGRFGCLNNYLLPAFGDTPLNELTAVTIEEAALEWKESGIHGRPVAGKTVNEILATLKTMLDWAVRKGKLPGSPMAAVERFISSGRERGIFTTEEATAMLTKPSLWRSPIHWAINLTGATTACRLGELMALRVKRVGTEFLEIRDVYRQFVGLVEGDTKTGKAGFKKIPLPQSTAKALAMICKGKGPDDLVFSEDGNSPVLWNDVAKELYRVMDLIGINETAREERFLTFHSWRHFFNSVLRRTLGDDAILRRLTGHTSEAMTENYYHLTEGDLNSIRKAQNEAFAGFIGE